MIKLTERTRGEFTYMQKSYDYLIGEKESDSQFYDFSICHGSNKLLIGLIHNYPNMNLEPQVEIKDNKLIVGNNEALTIINFDTKETKEFSVLPVFNKFFVCGERIIVMSDLVVFCIIEDNITWSINDFDDMIFFERLEDNKLIVSTYENQKEVNIDIITGKIIDNH